MKFKFAFTAAFVGVLSSIAIAQTPQPETPERSPTSNPSVKRRTFDQFDLANGIRLGSSSQTVDPKSALVVELVDQQTFDGIARMVKYAAHIESEYRSTEDMAVDPSHYYEPYRVLSRKLPALYRITEIFRVGLLEHPILTNPANVALLNQSQQILAEMQMIVNSTETQLARNQPKLLPIAERYGAPTYPVEKRPLLSAMFLRWNGNFARLMSQVALRK